MAKGPERLVRWIMGHTQPVPYSLDIEHPAMDDIAWAADEIERLQAELRADMERIVALEQQNEALASRLGAVEDELRHSVSVMSIVRSWLLENVRGSTHWENCEREHATCRAISQLGGVVERLSRLNLTAGVVERTVTNEETQ